MNRLRRYGILRGLFGDDRRAAGAHAARWQAAHQRDPRLAEDLIGLGGLLSIARHEPAPAAGDRRLAMTAEEMAYERGRKDLAVELLALMTISPADLHQLMERDDAR